MVLVGMHTGIEPHTLQRAEERGPDAQDIEDVLRTGTDVPAKGSRRAKAKVYPFGRLDDRQQPVMNERVSEDIVLDIGEGGRIVGIEILDASHRVNLERLLPVEYAGLRSE